MSAPEPTDLERMAEELLAAAELTSPSPWLVELTEYGQSSAGDNWLIAEMGNFDDFQENKSYNVHITTWRIHASDMHGDAKTCADFIVLAREAAPALAKGYLDATAALAQERARAKALEAALESAASGLKVIAGFKPTAGTRQKAYEWGCAAQEVLNHTASHEAPAGKGLA